MRNMLFSQTELKHLFIMFTTGAILSFLFATISCFATASLDLQCSVPGQCVNSEEISSAVEADKYACQASCKNNVDCEWFTFHTNLNVCTLFRNCQNITEANRDSCITSQKDCKDYQCNIQGSCQVSKMYCYIKM